MPLPVPLLSLLGLLTPTAHAATLSVDPSDSTAYATIQEAIDAAASGDTITVAAGTYTECIDLGGLDLTITGAGSSTTTLDGAGACDAAINADGGESLTLSGFTVANSGEQGLEGLNSDFVLDDMVFDGLGDSSGYYGYGGALMVDGGSLSATDCTFTSNEANYGAAIYATNAAVLVVDSSTFDGNTATYGGAIFLDDGSRGSATLTLSSSTLSSNTATYGGAVYGDDETELTTSNNAFTTNESEASGGVFYLSDDVVLTSTTDTFTDNAATGTYYQYGAAIYGYTGSSITVSAGTFSGGTAARAGDIYVYVGDLTITGSSFDGATATGNGASIYATGSVLDISSSTFSHNATDYTGAIYAYNYSTVSMDALTFTDNTADGSGADIAWSYGTAGTLASITSTGASAPNGYGGSIYISSSYGAVTASDLDISDAVASYGGALYVTGDNDVTLTDSTFSTNTATNYGGAVDIYAYYDEVALEVSNVAFTSNAATAGSGGGLYVYADTSAPSTLDLTDLTFSSNTAYYNGGGLYARGLTELTLDGTSFDSNATTYGYYNYYGGGGAYLSTVTDLSAHDVAFCTNDAESGGAMYLYNVATSGSSEWTNSAFLENAAGSYGGAVYIYGGGTQTFTNNVFLTSDAYLYGGAIYANAAALDFTNNIVSDSVDGDGLYAYDSDTAADSTITYNAFYNNRLADAGGQFTFSSTSDGNVSAEPLFRDYTADGDCSNDDLRLSSTSTLIDAGDPSLTDPDGSASDIGLYGGAGSAVYDADGDGYDNIDDCDDTDSAVSPAATESCNGIDDNCDGVVDEAGATGETTWFYDTDGDGYGDASNTVDACDAPSGTVTDDTDCDDTDSSVNPGEAEVPYDGIDQDCDSADLTDVDGDGFDSTAVSGGTDCNDDDPTVNPDATDTWYDGEDTDCDGADDYDQDGDGFASDAYDGDDCDDTNASVNPDATDIPEDGIDQDCDGVDADEGGDDGGTDDGGSGDGGSGDDGSGDEGSGDGGSGDGGSGDGGSGDGVGGSDDGGSGGDGTDLDPNSDDGKGGSSCSHVQGGDLAGAFLIGLLGMCLPRRRGASRR